MKGKSFAILCSMIMGVFPVYTQNVVKKIPDDAFGLTYSEVFENMHYDQPFRPQVHYTPITGQIADATGLILYKGTYHLFYMYDEWSRSRKFNKNWGHAVSHDCIFWEQKPQILNTVLDNRPGSGSGIVDWNNTLGLQSGIEKTLVVFYTDYGRGSCLAFSRDGGETWIRHKDNPVIPMREGKSDRDPLVFWYKPEQSWRLVQYEDPGFTFYKSSDLIHWEKLSSIEGFFECPDFIEMPIDGNEQNKKWVILDANCLYRIGDFNGRAFESKMENTRVDYGNLYATQTFKNSYEGDGPFIQLAFLKMTGKPDHDRIWSQQQCFPCELSLKTINNEVRLCRTPVDGIKQLRYSPHILSNIKVNPGDNPLKDIDGDVFEIIADVDPVRSEGFSMDIRGEKLTYSSKEQSLTFMENKAIIKPNGQSIRLRLIIDRNSVEVFVNKGEVTFSNLFYPDASNLNLELTSYGGYLLVKNLETYRLSSIWIKREQALGYYR